MRPGDSVPAVHGMILPGWPASGLQVSGNTGQGLATTAGPPAVGEDGPSAGRSSRRTFLWLNCRRHGSSLILTVAVNLPVGVRSDSGVRRKIRGTFRVPAEFIRPVPAGWTVPGRSATDADRITDVVLRISGFRIRKFRIGDLYSGLTLRRCCTLWGCRNLWCQAVRSWRGRRLSVSTPLSFSNAARSVPVGGAGLRICR